MRSRRSWLSRVILLELVFLLALPWLGAVGVGAPVRAGDTYGSAHCRSSAKLCRTTWSGDNSVLRLRIVNQLGSSQLLARAQTAYGNWNSARGPQSFSGSARTNDSLIYLKRDDTLPAPNGYVLNCTQAACPASMPANILYSEVFVPLDNLDYGNIAISVFGHEFGHTLGLRHHSCCTLMTQGTTYTSPHAYDIGALPSCTTSLTNDSSLYGVRCIYHWDAD